MKISLYILLLFSLFSCKTTKEINTQKKTIENENKPYVIKNVNVIPMTSDHKIIENTTVVIYNNIIQSINDSIPNKAQIIDGSGKWLIPGLIDMHVHNLADGSFSKGYPTRGSTLTFDVQNMMTPYVASGVTTIFELSGRIGHFSQRDAIAKGLAIGPRMAIAAVIDGKGDEVVATTPSDGRQSVRNAKGLGYRFIKVYTWLYTETFEAIIDEAKKQEMKVIGHIPITFKGSSAEDFFVPHFGMIAHAEELSKQTEDFSYEKAQEYARSAKENGTWLTPNLSNLVWITRQARSLESIRNLSTLKYVHPLMHDKWLTSNSYNQSAADRPELIEYFEKVVDFHKLLVKAFKEADVPMVAGTDAGTSGIVWGFSLHEELELLVDAGLTNEEALVSATKLPAEWLGINEIVGSIEVGKFADLVLLDKNPLDNIQNTRAISGVFVNGVWLDKKKIDKMLLNLAEWNTTMKDKYQWKNRKKY